MKTNKNFEGDKLSRRSFLRTTAVSTVALPFLGNLAVGDAFGQVTTVGDAGAKSQVFRVNNCPVHDGQLRHIGVDSLLYLLSGNGNKFYKTDKVTNLGGPDGIIAANDVVILKVNAQWKCRGGTNTDMLRGLIYRILQHPDGFQGEVVIYENGQKRPAAFDGLHCDVDKTEYNPFPELEGKVLVNAEEESLLTIDYLVGTVFAGQPVSSFLMDPSANIFIADDDHKTNGYRRVGEPGTPCVSYPCFTTAKGNRIELKDGIWNGTGYSQNLKLIHCPVLKDHSGTVGMTGALKIVYGTLSMSDGTSAKRHYLDLGSQCAKMWTLVRQPDLTILDCLWVSFGSMTVGKAYVSGCIGYPPSIVSRQNILLAGHDPIAMDYHANKHILFPLGGNSADSHNPENPNLQHIYGDARDTINAAGGIRGQKAQMGDDNIQVISATAGNRAAAKAWASFA